MTGPFTEFLKDRNEFNHLKGKGWHEIDIKNGYESRQHLDEIEEWANENLGGLYRRLGTNWIFQREVDASMFIMRWL